MEWFLQWCRRRGCRECKRNPKRFDLLKIRAKSLKIWAKSLKIWAKSLKIQTKALYLLAKSLKIWAKMRPNVVWLRKMALKVCRKTSEDHFYWGWSGTIPGAVPLAQGSNRTLSLRKWLKPIAICVSTHSTKEPLPSSLQIEAFYVSTFYTRDFHLVLSPWTLSIFYVVARMW